MHMMTASYPIRGRLPGYLLPIFYILFLLTGCSGKSINGIPEHVVGKPLTNADGSLPARDGDTDTVSGLSAVLAGQPLPQPAPSRPLNVLVMSGGGKYGAFTAGVLSGWTASGKRPTFDVATGISSGALVATLAFLGPKYDQKMANYFTTLKRYNVYRWRPIRGLCSRTGIMTSEPLQELLERSIDDEFLCDLRAAHTEGRRLYVATTDVLINRVAVWDLGALACSGRPDSRELIVKILTATCTPPGLIQPIEIDVEVNGAHYTELHADAGNILQAFVRTPTEIPQGSHFWVLSAGKYHRDPLKDPPRIINLLGGAVSNSLYALFRADLVKLYALCAVTRSQFRLIALPADFQVTASAFTFDPQELVRLYWVGYQLTAGSGGEWRTAPPDTLQGEAMPPRTGTQFTLP